MLVLARRLNERIIVPCVQAAIQVVGIQGGIVRLGIEAPADVKVFREEVLQKERVVDSPAECTSTGEEATGSLTDTAQELSELRRQLRGKLPASAAAALFRIDRALNDLARRAERSGKRVANLSVPAIH
jgi:carbon storage regulator